jgi:hypothetical protein
MLLSGKWWAAIESAALAAGLAGSAAACLAQYGWRWSGESATFLCLSAAPFGLYALCSSAARRMVRQQGARPVTAVLALVLAALSLRVYIGAVLHPTHSSGLAFAIVPLFSLIAIPAVLASMVIGFLAGGRMTKG